MNNPEVNSYESPDASQENAIDPVKQGQLALLRGYRAKMRNFPLDGASYEILAGAVRDLIAHVDGNIKRLEAGLGLPKQIYDSESGFESVQIEKVDADGNIEQADYLECKDPDCTFSGLVRVPVSKQRNWKSKKPGEVNEFEGIKDAQCPGCKNSWQVRPAEEIVPDLNDVSSLSDWLKKYNLERFEGVIFEELERVGSHTDIKRELVRKVGREYPRSR